MAPDPMSSRTRSIARAVPRLEGDGELDVRPLAGRDDRVGLGQVGRQRLLGEDVDAPLGTVEDHRLVAVDPAGRHRHELRLLAVEHGAVVGVGAVDAQPLGGGREPLRVVVGDRHHGQVRMAQHRHVQAVPIVAPAGPADHRRAIRRLKHDRHPPEEQERPGHGPRRHLQPCRPPMQVAHGSRRSARKRLGPPSAPWHRRRPEWDTSASDDVETSPSGIPLPAHPSRIAGAEFPCRSYPLGCRVPPVPVPPVPVPAGVTVARARAGGSIRLSPGSGTGSVSVPSSMPSLSGSRSGIRSWDPARGCPARWYSWSPDPDPGC